MEKQVFESFTRSSVLVRDWDSRNMREISVEEWEQAEKRTGKNSAFAETRAVLSNGIVAGTDLSVDKYLRYRNG